MRNRALFVAILLSLPASVYAQMPDTMPIVVQPTKILIGAEFVPRCAAPQNILTVLAGATFELLTDATWDCVEVFGTLRASRTHDTTLRATHLFIMPGGVLDVGTTADPVLRHVEFIIRNVPIDLIKDPFQWGNGLLNFGKQTRVGSKKLAHTTATGDLAKGATTVTLKDAPQGWTVGDEILIPDTGQPSPTIQPRREPTVTIAAIAGSQITLSKPLDFEHLCPRDPDGAIVSFPYVANLTQNIVIRSEDPNGTPGHTADVGHMATWDIEYNQLLGLGRTRNVTRIDATPDATAPSGFKAGSNNKGRYADHHHHALGFNSKSIGNVLIGIHPPPITDPRDGIVRTFGPTWGLVLHNVHDALVTDNIAIGFTGAGFVTEDGNEVRNVFRHNLAAYNLGNHDGTPGCESANIKTGNPGACGNGFFLRGVRSVIERNVGTNNAIGIDLFTIDAVPLTMTYPSTPGGMADTPFDLTLARPLSYADNATNSNTATGPESWFIQKFPHINHQMIYNGLFQALQGTSNPARPYFVNPTAVCKTGSGALGIVSSLAYAQSFDLEGGRIVGCATGIPDGGAEQLTVTGTLLQNQLDIDLRDLPKSSRFTNVTHKILPGYPPQFIHFYRGPEVIWNGTGPLPDIGTSPWRQQRGSSQVIENWQGDGKSYQLLRIDQLGSLPAWPSSQDPTEKHVFNCRDTGLTMQQCWDTYGMSVGGDVVPDAQAIRPVGLLNGYMRVGASRPLGTPAAILTSPTPRASARVFFQDGLGMMTRLYFVLTGDPAAALGPFLISIDGGPWLEQGPTPAESPLGDDRVRTVPAPPEGAHTIRTLRTDANKQPIQSTLRTFPGSLVIGPVVIPPPQTTVIVPNVVGMTEANARAAIVAAKLVAAVIDTTPPGQTGRVTTETPAAGSTVNIGTTVTLVIAGTAPPTTVAVPNVVGKPEAAARADLIAANLTVGAVTRETNQAAVGVVLRQAPIASTVVALGAPVSLVVSSGPVITPPPTLFSMPSGTYTICDSSTPPKCFTLVKP